VRNPKLNISLKNFLQISADILTEQQAIELFKRACKFKPEVFIFKTTKKNQEKIEKILRPNNVSLFNATLTQERLHKKHIFSVIHNSDSEWATLNEIASDALEFCKLYDFEESQGYSYYIKKGLSFMGNKYALNKFKYYKSKIYEAYNQVQVLSNDPDPNLTDNIYKLFCRVYNIRPNQLYRDKHIVDFVYIADRVRESNIKYDKYLECQIEFYKNINKIPEPSYFHTQEALERTYKLKR